MSLTARVRLLLGSLTLPAVFLLHGHLESLASLGFLLLASLLVGYRLWWRKLWPMLLGLLIFYLLLPKGQVLWSARLPWGWEFRLTSGALVEAVLTIVFLVQLLLLSGFSMDKNLRLPGRWGGQLARVLLLYHLLLQRSSGLSFRQPFASLDRILLQAEADLAALSASDDKMVAAVEKKSQSREKDETASMPVEMARGGWLLTLFYAVILVLPCWLLVLRRWW